MMESRFRAFNDRLLNFMRVSARLAPCFWLLRFSALLIAIFAAGCGRKGLYPVKGKVVFPDGAPLTAGTVEFRPVTDALLAPRGEIKVDGSFRASTYAEGDGAPPGTYRVVITPPEQLDPGQPRPLPFDRRFSNFQKSGLEYTVKEGKNEFFTITVEQQSARGKTP
jgi:hypothetical protein